MADYRIKDLAVLTGIKAHTIRIWEKRYGLLSPNRTATQIRTYRDQELMQLLNIALLNRNGFKISKIAEMSDQQISEKVAALTQTVEHDTSIGQLIAALIQMDEQLFRSTLHQLCAAKGLQATFQEYIIPFLERIGVMWMVGTINPAQEHFISNLIRQKLIAETDALPTPAAGAEKVLLFLPEHEWHEIGLLLYHYHLRSRGIFTVYLGQSIPYPALLATIDALQPTQIVTSWILSVEVDFMRTYFERLHADYPAIPIAAGGFQVQRFSETIAPFAQAFHSLEGLDLLFPASAIN